jgi:multiple sugar transport system substrate-binding protein
MLTIRSLRILFMLLILSLVLAACGTGPAAPAGQVTQAPAAADGEGEAAEEEAPATQMEPQATTVIASAGTGNKKVQVTVWLGAQELEAMVKLADRFTQTHPDIQVEFINIIEGGPFGRDKVQQMIAGGTPPDLFMLNTGQFEGFASRGVLRPLDDLVQQDNFDLSIYWPPAVEGSKYDGKLYGLPKDISDHVIYLNVDLFEKAGIPLPSPEWTWNDYRQIAKQLTKDTNGDGNIDQWGT